MHNKHPAARTCDGHHCSIVLFATAAARVPSTSTAHLFVKNALARSGWQATRFASAETACWHRRLTGKLRSIGLASPARSEQQAIAVVLGSCVLCHLWGSFGSTYGQNRARISLKDSGHPRNSTAGRGSRLSPQGLMFDCSDYMSTVVCPSARYIFFGSGTTTAEVSSNRVVGSNCQSSGGKIIRALAIAGGGKIYSEK